eukprot:6458611-Amphidinium_carterae.3
MRESGGTVHAPTPQERALPAANVDGQQEVTTYVDNVTAQLNLADYLVDLHNATDGNHEFSSILVAVHHTSVRHFRVEAHCFTTVFRVRQLAQDRFELALGQAFIQQRPITGSPRVFLGPRLTARQFPLVHFCSLESDPSTLRSSPILQFDETNVDAVEVRPLKLAESTDDILANHPCVSARELHILRASRRRTEEYTVFVVNLVRVTAARRVRRTLARAFRVATQRICLYTLVYNCNDMGLRSSRSRYLADDANVHDLTHVYVRVLSADESFEGLLVDGDHDVVQDGVRQEADPEGAEPTAEVNPANVNVAQQAQADQQHLRLEDALVPLLQRTQEAVGVLSECVADVLREIHRRQTIVGGVRKFVKISKDAVDNAAVQALCGDLQGIDTSTSARFVAHLMRFDSHASRAVYQAKSPAQRVVAFASACDRAGLRDKGVYRRLAADAAEVRAGNLNTGSGDLGADTANRVVQQSGIYPAQQPGENENDEALVHDRLAALEEWAGQFTEVASVAEASGRRIVLEAQVSHVQGELELCKQQVVELKKSISELAARSSSVTERPSCTDASRESMSVNFDGLPRRVEYTEQWIKAMWYRFDLQFRRVEAVLEGVRLRTNFLTERQIRGESSATPSTMQAPTARPHREPATGEMSANSEDGNHKCRDASTGARLQQSLALQAQTPLGAGTPDPAGDVPMESVAAGRAGEDVAVPRQDEDVSVNEHVTDRDSDGYHRQVECGDLRPRAVNGDGSVDGCSAVEHPLAPTRAEDFQDVISLGSSLEDNTCDEATLQIEG